MASTTYKFLDIEIIIGSISHVPIAIGDNRDNRIFIRYVTWKTFIERHADRLMQSIVPSSPIQDLNVELVKMLC